MEIAIIQDLVSHYIYMLMNWLNLPVLSQNQKIMWYHNLPCVRYADLLRYLTRSLISRQSGVTASEPFVLWTLVNKSPFATS